MCVCCMCVWFKYYRMRFHWDGLVELHRWCETNVSFSLISSMLMSMAACMHSLGVNGVPYRYAMDT